MLPELESNLDFLRSLLLSVRNERIRIELVYLVIVHTLGKGSLRMLVAGFEVSWSVVASQLTMGCLDQASQVAHC